MRADSSWTGPVRTLFVSALLAITAVAAPAQGTPGHVTAGDTIRLFGGREELVRGTVAGSEPGGLLMVPAHSADTVRYLFAQVTRAEVQRGTRRRGAPALAKGAGAGLAIGAALAGVGIAARDPRNEGIDVLVSLFAGVLSTVVGTVVGGVAAFTHTELWVPFDPVTGVEVPDAR